MVASSFQSHRCLACAHNPARESHRWFGSVHRAGRHRQEPCLAGLSPGRLLDELMQRIRQFAVLIGAALAQLSRYLFGNVANPTFREIKANDANGVAVPSFPQIVDDCIKIGVFNVYLA